MVTSLADDERKRNLVLDRGTKIFNIYAKELTLAYNTVTLRTYPYSCDTVTMDPDMITLNHVPLQPGNIWIYGHTYVGDWSESAILQVPQEWLEHDGMDAQILAAAKQLRTEQICEEQKELARREQEHREQDLKMLKALIAKYPVPARRFLRTG